MQKEMIVSSNGHETMVAILEDDLVAEIFVERERHRGVVGNVYKGRVSKVLPGMQSSFIDIGLERDGFLYVAEVIDTLGYLVFPNGHFFPSVSFGIIYRFRPLGMSALPWIESANFFGSFPAIRAAHSASMPPIVGM